MVYLFFRLILAGTVLAGCATQAVHPSLRSVDKLPPLIPVHDFVANRGSNFAYSISPDGSKLAWVAVKGVSLHFFIKDLRHGTVRALPAGNFYGRFVWAQDSRHLLFSLTLRNGYYGWVSMDTAQATPKLWYFTPSKGVRAFLVAQSIDKPMQVLVAHNQRDPSLFDLYRVDLRTFKQTLVAKNPGDVSQWLAGPRGNWVGCIVKQGKAFALKLNRTGTRLLYHWSQDDDVRFVSLADQGRRLYLLSNKGRDRTVLLEIDTASGAQQVVYAEPEVDIEDVYAEPLTGKPLLAYSDPDYPKAVRLDTTLPHSFGLVPNPKAPANLRIVSSDDAFRQLVLRRITDKDITYYLYDRKTRQATLIGVWPMDAYKPILADMRPIAFKSRDSVLLHGYLTLPKGVAPQHLPMVLLVHGGPWMRDTWRYDSYVQFLANRGYAVLQVNYRGSSGYGRHFQELAIGQFAGKMQDDLLDGVKWAIAQGIADPKHIAIVGTSYGGYAALVGLSATPRTFACGIDVSGPTDLARLIEQFPSYDQFWMRNWRRYVGNPGNAQDRAAMRAESPLFETDKIIRPLLVIQGGKDPRVRPQQSIDLVQRLRQEHKQVEFWLVPNAGHGLVRWPLRLKQFRMTEDFLASCLGGRSGGFDYYQLAQLL